MAKLQLIVLLCVGLVQACDWREDLDGSRRVPPGIEASQPHAEAPSDDRVAIDLLALRPLMLAYRLGTLTISAADAGFVAHIDGGARGDWHRNLTIKSEGGQESASLVGGLAAQLYFPVDADPGGIDRAASTLPIAFRAKSAVEKQLVSVFLNERKITDLSMPTTKWTNYSINVPMDAVVEGENKLRFYFRSAAEVRGRRSAAAFSDFRIGSTGEDGSRGFLHQATTIEGRRLASLRVDAPSRLSFFLQIPKSQPRLRFSIAGAASSVRIRPEASTSTKVVWTGAASTSWKDVSVDLADYRGQMVRLDLLSEGAASWGQPVVGTKRGAKGIGKHPTADNIVLWSVSSLRSERLRSMAARPFRDFMDSGIAVVRGQSSVPAAGGAHASMMTGGLHVKGRVADSGATLAQRLQDAGYATALISGNGFVNDTAGYARGFSYYDNPMRRQHHHGARTLWRLAKKFLQKHKKQKTFLYVATVEAHVPYRPNQKALAAAWSRPAPFPTAQTASISGEVRRGRRTLNADERAYVRALYDASVAEVASAFEVMLTELSSLELSGTTAVILVGDHGEELWERGGFGHDWSLYQEALETPIALRMDGVSPRRLTVGVSTMDVHATVLGLAGLHPDGPVVGQSLLLASADDDPLPLLSGMADGSRSVKLGRYKLIVPAGGTVELYDLRTDHDELNNIATSRPIVCRVLRNSLSLARAYEGVWSSLRWGSYTSPKEAFARDQGL